MWKECRLWIIDSLVSITLFLLVPILLSLTGLVTISVAPGAALIVLGYALYIFQCVFSRDMKRGIWALVDLMRNISVTHTFTVQEIQSCHSHFSVSRRVSEQTFAKYFIIRCINDAEHVIDLVTVNSSLLLSIILIESSIIHFLKLLSTSLQNHNYPHHLNIFLL